MSHLEARCQYTGDQYKPAMVKVEQLEVQIRYMVRDKEGVEI